MSRKGIRNLYLVFGDQLDPEADWLRECDPAQDAIWMAEASFEAEYGWSTKQRIAVFFAAMRHYAAARREAGHRVYYSRIGEGSEATLGAKLQSFLDGGRVGKLAMVRPGEWRILEGVRKLATKAGLELEVREDGHFFATPEDFDRWADGRKELRMEYFYREMRRSAGVLLDGDKPVGGKWNYDAANRESFGKKGPGEVPPPRRFEPDAITREVMADVEEHFADHPGRVESFGWPVTPGEAAMALDDFIVNRLPSFGQYQDAMWTGEPFLYHSLISVGLNLKLLPAREAVRRAEEAFQKGQAPLEAVEGFIRQILGWREYVRGVYWRFMPEYLERNALGASSALPEFYWNGDTEMRCLREAIGQTLDHGYAHHIQRLMVTGLYAMLLGVAPKEIAGWYLGVYVDAVEWVELPNVLGMSQYGDGGIMGSKPYAATGKYISRMSNYCTNCRFRPDQATGEDACPFTVLYWDFLARHRETLDGNQRMRMQLKNVDRKKPEELAEIRKLAKSYRLRKGIGK